MANYNLTQTGDEVQAYIDSIPVIDVTGTLNGSAITFGSNPYSQIAANYAADCSSIVRLTVGTAVYLLRVTQYDGTNYTASEMSGAHNVVATIGSSSASATIDAGIDATPTQGSDNLVKSGGVAGELYGAILNKEITWSNGYVNTSGTILAASSNQFSQPILLNKGEQVVVETSGVVKSVIAWTSATSVTIGSVLTPIVMSASTAHAIFTYTADEDIYIVLTVLINDFHVTFYGTNGVRQLEKNIANDLSFIHGGVIDLSQYPVRKGSVQPTYKWWYVANGYQYILIPINSPFVGSFHSTRGTSIAFLKSYTPPKNRDLLDLSTEIGVVSIAADSTYKFLTPSDAKFIAVNVKLADVDIVVTLTIYGYDYIVTDIASGENGETITREELYYGKIGQGLIDSTTGEVAPDTTSYPNAILPIGDDWEYIYTYNSAFSGNYGYGFFLQDNSWVGTHTTAHEWHKIPVPKKAVEFRTCWMSAMTDKQMFIIGKKTTMQQSFDITKNVLPFQFLPNFSKINDIPTQTRLPQTSDINDIYGRYDALMALYPNYVTRIDCSDADSVLGITRPSALDNIPIYIYKFSPLISRYEGDWKGKSLPKAMIVTGTHSNEKMGIYTTYSLMKYMCDTWKTDENAEMLRTMCEIYVMPLVNPWGFIHAGETISGVTIPGRDNYNNVNLNRNFPTSNWKYIAPSSTGDYSGETAGSEYETKIVMYYIEQIMPDFFLDAHTGGMNAYGAFHTINTIKEIRCRKVALAAGRTGTTILIKSDSNFPDNADTSLVDVGGGNDNGEAYIAGWEKTGKLSFLTEQCVEQRWLNGTLTTRQSINTDLIYTMNMKMTMNLLLRGLKAATEL